MEVEDSASSRYKSSQKETSYSNNDIAGEEALDYGEEEDDEERNENDPQEFSWTRRILRYNNKPSYTAPTCKWKMEEDGKHLMVKSNLLNVSSTIKLFGINAICRVSLNWFKTDNNSLQSGIL